jgi:hypothetical protein
LTSGPNAGCGGSAAVEEIGYDEARHLLELRVGP